MPATSGTVSMANARTGAISGWENAGGQVTIAAIANDAYDRSVLQVAGDAKRDVQGAAGRNSRKDPLLARHAPRHLFRLCLAHVFKPVDAQLVVDLRQVGFRPFADAGNLRSVLRLAAHDLDLGVLFLEETRTSHDRTRRAHAGDEVRDPALRVAPDFGAGGLVVRQRIVGIGKLVKHDALALAYHLLRQVARTLHSAALRCEDQLRAVSPHRAFSLRGLVFGHDQQHAVAADRGRHRQPDSGVAAGRLDQGVPGLDPAALLGAPDHRDRRSILDRTGGIVPLELRKNHIAVASYLLARDALQSHQGGIADEILDRALHRRFSAMFAQQVRDVGPDTTLHGHEVLAVACFAQQRGIRFGEALILADQLWRKRDVFEQAFRNHVPEREPGFAPPGSHAVDHRTRDVVEALRSPGAAVEDSGYFAVFEKMQIHIHHIVDMNEVAPLLAVGVAVRSDEEPNPA